MPFLLHAPTIGVSTPLRSAMNNVGEPPKSESEICCVLGIRHPSSNASVVPLRRTIDEPHACFPLPVVTMTEPSGKTAGELQMLAPLSVLGKECQNPISFPVDWLNAINPAGTRGLSHIDAMPIYTVPFTTRGEPQA